MNRLGVSIGILSVMTAGCTAAVITSSYITDKMSAMVNDVEQAFTDGDTESCVAAANELTHLWNDMMYYSILINDLGHAVEITSSIAEIQSFAETQNDELYAACDRAQAQIDMFRDTQVPTFWKII